MPRSVPGVRNRASLSHPHRPMRCRLTAALVLALPCGAAAQGPTQFVATTAQFLTGAYPVAAVFDDFDRDGAVDFCVVSGFGPQVQVLHNDGLGNLTASPLPPVTIWSSAAVAFVDLEGDGDRDLFLSWPRSAGQNVALFRYMGGSLWLDASASVPAMPTFNSAMVGDLDGDGDEDIVGGGMSIGSGMSGILTNVGGAFTWAAAFGGQQGIVALGDIDGDGDLDVATMLPLQLWRNDGAMVFTNVTATQVPPLPLYWAHLVFADVDGDGDQDLVLGDEVNYVNQFDRLLRNVGGGTFVEVPGAIPPHPGAHTLSVAFADVDGDGDLDLIRGGNPQPNLSLNDGTGLFTLATGRLPPLASVIAEALAADLDRDGDADIVLHTTGQPGQILWNRHRHVAVPAPPAIGQNWTIEVSSQPGYGTGTRAAVLGLGVARLAQPVVVSPFGVLWLDLGAPIALLQTLIGPGAGPVPLTFAIPPSPPLVGMALHVQALVEETAGTGDARLTSLVSTTIH